MKSRDLNTRAIEHALASFNASPEREQIDELLAAQTRDREAVERAETTIADLRSEITRIRYDQEDDPRITDALRSGDVLEEIETDVEKLRAQIDQLNASRAKIERDMRERRLQIEAARNRIRLRLAPIGSDAIDALERKASEAISALASIYADVEALRHSIGAAGAGNLSFRLTPILEGGWSQWSQIRNKSETVNPDIVKALETGAEAITMSGGTISQTVQLPKL